MHGQPTGQYGLLILSGTFNAENSVTPLLHSDDNYQESLGDSGTSARPVLLVHNRLFVPVRHSVRNVDDR